MTGRCGVAAAFAAAIALVLLLRNEGFLHGRVEGGPLTLSSLDAAVSLAPRETAGLGLRLLLDGDPVEVERVRPEFVSPGLRILGPRRAPIPCDQCEIARWPPAGTTPLRGAAVADPSSSALLGVRAQRPGIYYVHDLTALYRRGLKGFRRRLRADFCVEVRRRMRLATCAPGYRPPRGEAAVVEAGGPSRYGVRVRDGVARYRAEPGRRPLVITLANIADTRRRVTDIAAELEGIAIRQVRPRGLVIPPGRGRRVRLEIAVDTCPAAAGTLDALEGRIGDEREAIPLSVPLEFTPC